MIPWTTITSLGDIQAMAPVAATIGLGLAIGRAWRMAILWCVLLAVSLGLVVTSKVAFIGWCIGSPTLDFTGFSGHAMRVTAIAPVLFYLLLQHASSKARAAGIFLGLMCGAVVGISRLALHDHSTAEVVAGWALGALVSLGFILIFRSAKTFVLNKWLVALSLAIILAAPYAEPAPTQSWMIDVALFISGHDQPCTRSDWK
ncbi:MAG: phosphatase PAP2 family protein [Burkholderiaceae bacterium]